MKGGFSAESESKARPRERALGAEIEIKLSA
jgi:hypothetical protein